jgi:hypothetical protein
VYSPWNVGNYSLAGTNKYASAAVVAGRRGELCGNALPAGVIRGSVGIICSNCLGVKSPTRRRFPLEAILRGTNLGLNMAFVAMLTKWMKARPYSGEQHAAHSGIFVTCDGKPTSSCASLRKAQSSMERTAHTAPSRFRHEPDSCHCLRPALSGQRCFQPRD